MENKSLFVAFEGSETTIPYIEMGDSSLGPHLFISGGMHGDEVNGIAGVQHFLQYAERENLEQRLKGKLTILPILNPPGFTKMERRVTDDHVDLNRSFGIEEPTTFAEAMAKTLSEEIFKHCRLGIDLHDAGGGSALLPHSRVLKHEEDGCTKNMGQLFGTKVIIEREGHPNMMAVALHRLYGTSVITVETGGAQHVFPAFMDQILEGIINVLIAYKLIEGEISMPQNQFLLQKRFGIQAAEPGIVKIDAELGSFVHGDEHIGEIYFPISQHTEELRSPMCGLLFAKWHKSQIPRGSVIYAILETHECHVKRTTLDMFKELPHFNLKQFNFSK